MLELVRNRGLRLDQRRRRHGAAPCATSEWTSSVSRENKCESAHARLSRYFLFRVMLPNSRARSLCTCEREIEERRRALSLGHPFVIPLLGA